MSNGKNSSKFDVTILYADAKVDPRGRNYAEKIKILLERFVKITGCPDRRPDVFLPEPDFLSSTSALVDTRSILMTSRYVFIIATRELCVSRVTTEAMSAEFGDIFSDKRARQQLIPVYASFSGYDVIPNHLLPFGFENIVGINVSEIASPRRLTDIDMRKIKSKHLQMMYIKRFAMLLDPSQRTRRITPIYSPSEKAKREELYRIAHEMNQNRRKKRGELNGRADAA